jgi:hypothetical protein
MHTAAVTVGFAETKNVSGRSESQATHLPGFVTALPMTTQLAPNTQEFGSLTLQAAAIAVRGEHVIEPVLQCNPIAHPAAAHDCPGATASHWPRTSLPQVDAPHSRSIVHGTVLSVGEYCVRTADNVAALQSPAFVCVLRTQPNSGCWAMGEAIVKAYRPSILTEPDEKQSNGDKQLAPYTESISYWVPIKSVQTPGTLSLVRRQAASGPRQTVKLLEFGSNPHWPPVCRQSLFTICNLWGPW